MLPDPAMFSVEGVVFGVTSADVLFHLGKEELARQSVRTDRIKRLASHLIQQVWMTKRVNSSPFTS